MNIDLVIINAILLYLNDKNTYKWYITLTNNFFDAHL